MAEDVTSGCCRSGLSSLLPLKIRQDIYSQASTPKPLPSLSLAMREETLWNWFNLYEYHSSLSLGWLFLWKLVCSDRWTSRLQLVLCVQYDGLHSSDWTDL